MFNKRFIKEPTEKQRIGQIGEDLACEYLSKNGYKVIERNYLKKWGEIDIITKKGSKIHFVEVKAVTRETNEITRIGDSYRPEDNMHPWKLQRLGRAIQSYLLDKDVADNIDWQFDVATVYLDQTGKLQKILILEDIVL
ncbi:MAG: YraN family protein [Minisyncoccia bacterium]